MNVFFLERWKNCSCWNNDYKCNYYHCVVRRVRWRGYRYRGRGRRRVDGRARLIGSRKQRAQVRYVSGGQPERVQLGQLGVRRHPRQGGLEPAERLAQHPHPSPLPGVGRVPRTPVFEQIFLWLKLLLLLLFWPPVWSASAHVTSETITNIINYTADTTTRIHKFLIENIMSTASFLTSKCILKMPLILINKF